MRRILGLIAIAFGALTIVSGGSVLFGGAQVAQAAGNTVPWVVWFNTLSGVVYIVAGLGVLWRATWAGVLAWALVAALALAWVGLLAHVLTGGAFEVRTLGAMALRLGLWIVIAVWLHRATQEN